MRWLRLLSIKRPFRPFVESCRKFSQSSSALDAYVPITPTNFRTTVHVERAEGKITAKLLSDIKIQQPLVKFADDSSSAREVERELKAGHVVIFTGGRRKMSQLYNKMKTSLRTEATTAMEQLVKPPYHAEYPPPIPDLDPSQLFARNQFLLYRMHQEYMHNLLERFVLMLNDKCRFDLHDRQDDREERILHQAWGNLSPFSLVPINQLFGMISTAEWKRKEFFVKALGQSISIDYGVFPPTRDDYTSMLSKFITFSKPLDQLTAWDIGTGTGVLAAILAKKGVKNIIATDTNPRAVALANANFAKFGFSNVAKAVLQDGFPQEGRADVIVCNPPWLPWPAQSDLDAGSYDQDSQLLTAFLSQVGSRLSSNGVAWLILSDLAEIVGLRPWNFIEKEVTKYGLRVQHKYQQKLVATSSKPEILRMIRAREQLNIYCITSARHD